MTGGFFFFVFFRSLKVLLHLLGTFELYYRARIYVGRAFFFSSPRVSYYDSVQHAHPALKKEPNKFSRRRNLFFFFFLWLLVAADTFTAFGVAFSWASGPNKSTSLYTLCWAGPGTGPL